MSGLPDELAAIDAFRNLTAADRDLVASLCRERPMAAGHRLLEQGRSNASLYFLRSGRAAVRLRRAGGVETLAHLSAPAVVGEVSFLTGRPCSADIDIVVDAVVAELPRDVLATTDCHDRVVQGLAVVVAGRLYDTNVGGDRQSEARFVLLRPGRNWRAPSAFASRFTEAIGAEAGHDSLLLTTTAAGEVGLPRRLGEHVWTASIGPIDRPAELRGVLARSLPDWINRFAAVVMACPPEHDGIADTIRPLATHVGHLIGGGEAVPEVDGSGGFLVQDARQSTLPRLTVTSRLIDSVAEAERAHLDGHAVPESFDRGVASVARAVLGTTLGLVLGAGGARGWSHIGALDVLTRAGLPIDAVAGSSMGAIVGGLVALGTPVADLKRVVAEWPRRRRQLREVRVWRMHVASSGGIEDLLKHFFGDRLVTSLMIPYAANAVDIERAEEVVITSGLLRQATRASMAFPGWLPPIALDGRVLVDGATLHPMPWAACRALGPHRTIGINVLGPPAPRALPRKWPMRQFEVMARTFQLSGYAMGESREEAPDSVITPDLGDATMLSFDRYDEMVEAGARAAEARLPAVLAAYRAQQAGTRRERGIT